ncbi:MAG TPA: NmrA family NAD(P)-binding protein [Myxococcales bacterium]|nr:NmrA family NAD(P)-binding protein [Myxococcales bacterium]
MAKSIITVIGGTGLQGGGVVEALLARGEFRVRVTSRNPASAAARALAARDVEVVYGDLLAPSSLVAAFDGAYGAFVVTNFWEPGQGEREAELGAAAVRSARAAGVEHLIWSTLPDVEKLSGGRLKVLHFTGKAQVDAAVRSAGFARHTFVEAPFYFQNFLTSLAPQSLPNGGRGWVVPMDPTKRVIHAGDVNEVGKTAAAAFSARGRLPDGSVLAVAGGVYSWNDFVGTLKALGHDVEVVQVPAETYDGLFPGAHEIREMFQYFEEHTYFGPRHEAHIAAARALVPGGFTTFADWARTHMKPIAGASVRDR